MAPQALESFHTQAWAMSVRIKVRINGAATGAMLKVEPGFTTKEQLLTDGLKKLGVDKNDVDMHAAAAGPQGVGSAAHGVAAAGWQDCGALGRATR